MKKQSGFTVMELLISAALGVMVLTLLYYLMNSRQKSEFSSENKSRLLSMAQLIEAQLYENTGWMNTISSDENSRANGSALDCLNQKTLPCTDDPTKDISSGGIALENMPIHVLRDQLDHLMIDNRDPQSGLSVKGEACTSFNGTVGAGSDECPLRWDFRWSALCTPTTCVLPAVKVSARLIYNPAKMDSVFASFVSKLAFDVFPVASPCIDPDEPFSLTSGNCNATNPHRIGAPPAGPPPSCKPSGYFVCRACTDAPGYLGPDDCSPGPHVYANSRVGCCSGRIQIRNPHRRVRKSTNSQCGTRGRPRGRGFDYDKFDMYCF